MKKVIFGIMALAMISIFLNGCGQAPDPYNERPDTDVTSSAQFNFKSFAGTVWKTKVKMALADVKRYTNEHAIDLLPPEGFDPSHPKYSPPPHMEKLIAELPVGTRLRIERLMKDNGNWGGVRVAAVLQDGSYFQKTVYLDECLLAKNRFLWPGEADSKEWGVDPDML